MRPREIAIVTGANSGIGKEVTAGLMQEGYHVLMACRSRERCAAAESELNARGLLGSCECSLPVDLTDYDSIRAFVSSAALPDERPSSSSSSSPPSTNHRRQVKVLVNNAAVMGGSDQLRPNHSGPYLLTRLLLPHMAPGGRIVNVASEAHYRGSLAFELDSGAGTSGQPLLRPTAEPANWYRAYARSKLANVLFTGELSRRLRARSSSVTAYSVSPGRVATNIFANIPGPLRTPLEWLARMTFQTPAQGARTVLQAALSPELRGRHELYMHAQKPKLASPAARDAQLAAQLWQWSSREVGLTAEEDAALWPPA